jgi:hypothetical protein
LLGAAKERWPIVRFWEKNLSEVIGLAIIQWRSGNNGSIGRARLWCQDSRSRTADTHKTAGKEQPGQDSQDRTAGQTSGTGEPRQVGPYRTGQDRQDIPAKTGKY